MKSASYRAALLVLLVGLLLTASCSRADRAQRTVIQNKGSDTIVNLAQAWAEGAQAPR